MGFKQPFYFLKLFVGIELCFSVCIQAQPFRADILGPADTVGAVLQLATPSENHYLRLFSGRNGDPQPFLYFSELDTFRIASGSGNFSNFKENLTVYNGLGTGASPTSFIGINNIKPRWELDVRTSQIDDGSEINIGNVDNSHFLRLFSGRQNLPYPVIFWKQGDSLSLGTDENTYTEIMRLRDDGTMFLNSNNGIVLDSGNRPLITRGYDPFSSGTYKGLGRWGIFMEPFYLTFGMPDLASRGFQFVSYHEDGSIAQNQMLLKDGNLGINNTNPQYKLDLNGDANITGTFRINDDPGSPGQVLTSNGAADPFWNTISTNPQIGFKVETISLDTISTTVETSLQNFTEKYDDSNNFDPIAGTFTIPSNGVYHFDFLIQWYTLGPTHPEVVTILRIRRNSSTIEQYLNKVSLQSNYGEHVFYGSNIKCTNGDVIDFTVTPITILGDVSVFAVISGFKIY